MAPSMACLAGTGIHKMQKRGLIAGNSVGRRRTPFGTSEEIFLIDGPAPFYLLPIHGAGRPGVADSAVNYRANLYALKDMAVQYVLGFSAAGAISHNHNVGDLVLVTDLIDRTTRRANTFFEDTALGVLRQFPVFCTYLHQAMADCLAHMGCRYRQSSTLVVSEGPRLETPAEVRCLAAAGGELVGHSFAPEAFLAKELELCYAGVVYVANYAETGSRYRPFSASDLFGGLAAPSDTDRLGHTHEILAKLIGQVGQYLTNHVCTCECDKTMRAQVAEFGLSDDWRQWFDAAAKGTYQVVAAPAKVAVPAKVAAPAKQA